ncbi:MAG: hypothetical protein JKY43_04210 [Phycisphaerales bacterium]|nr:hypothetical protein [Phycisphaerales bacterium]
MSTIISRTKAKQLTLLYQVTAAVCVLGAVAVGVLGLPESAASAQINDVSQPPITPLNPGGGLNAESTSIETQQTRIDPGSISARLSMLDNAPLISIVAVTTPTINPVDQVSEESGSLAKRVRYTGYIDDSDQKLAFIRIDGMQRIVAEGSIAQAGSMGLDNLTITTVRPRFIVVTDGQIEDRIPLATKNAISVTMSTGQEVIAPPKRLTLADMVLTDEELAEINKLPVRQRKSRETMLRRQKLGRPGPGAKKPLASFRSNAALTPEQFRQSDNN